MSDSTQQYILRPDAKIRWHEQQRQWIIRIGDYDEGSIQGPEYLFQPLDIPDIEKQLEGHLASFIVNVTEYVDLCDHAQNAEELNAIREHFNSCQHEHIAEVLALFGLEQGSDK